MNRYLIFIVLLSAFQCVMAASKTCTTQAPGLSIYHCINCGNVLLGAAHIDRNSIRWEGNQIASLIKIDGGGEGFGVTGAFQQKSGASSNSFFYTRDTATNTWSYISMYESFLAEAAAGNDSPSTGLFFAPVDITTRTATFRYGVNLPNYVSYTDECKPKGTGVADTSNALTLDVQKSTDSGNLNKTIFKITPELEAVKLPAGIQQPKYAFVEVYVTEQNNGCSPAQYSEVIQTPQNFSEDNYYHSLAGESSQNTCQRYYQFLATIGKFFTFTAQKVRTTDKGDVKYEFFIRGHYGVPESHKTFSLNNTGTVTPPPSTKTINITVNGNGSVSGKDTKGVQQTCSNPPANIPTSPTAGCVWQNWQYDAINPTVTLTTTTTSLSYSFTGVDAQTTTCQIDPTNNKQIIVDLRSDAPTCTVQFTQSTASSEVKIEQLTINDGSTTKPIGTSSENPIPIPDNGQLTFFLIKRGGEQKQHIGETKLGTDGTGTITVSSANGTYDLMVNSGNTTSNSNVGAFTSTNAKNISVKLTPTSTKKVSQLQGSLTDLTVRRSLRVSQTDEIEATVEYQDQSGDPKSLRFATIYVAAAEPTSAVKACISLKTKTAQGAETTIDLTDNPTIIPSYKIGDTVTLISSCQDSNSQQTDTWHVIAPPDYKMSMETKTPYEFKLGSAAGTYLVTLLVCSKDGKQCDSADTKIDVSGFTQVDFIATTNANEATLTNLSQLGLNSSQPVDMGISWFTKVSEITQTGQSDAPIESPYIFKESGQHLVILQVTDNQTKQTASVSKIVTTVDAVPPTAKPVATLSPTSGNGQLIFNLDGATSCDSDNRDASGKNVCEETYDLKLSKGITRWEWSIKSPQPTTLKIDSPQAEKSSIVITNDAFGAADTVSDTVSPIINLKVTDDDNLVKGETSREHDQDVTINVTRPRVELQGVNNINAGDNMNLTATNGATTLLDSKPISTLSGYSWGYDGGEGNLTYCINKTSCQLGGIPPGKHLISLKVTDNYGLSSRLMKQDFFAGHSLNSLNSIGQEKSIAIELENGTEKRDETYSAVFRVGRALRYSSTVTEKTELEPTIPIPTIPRIIGFETSVDDLSYLVVETGVDVAESDKNQPVELVAVLSVDNQYFSVQNTVDSVQYDVDNPLAVDQPLNSWIGKIKPLSASPISIASSYLMDVKLAFYTPNCGKDHYLFVGYKVGTNKIVYAPHPIMIRISCNQQ